MKGQKFEDSKGRVVKVENIENNIATLNNGERVSTERLGDSNFYKPMAAAPQATQTINENVTTVIDNTPTPSNEGSRYENMLESLKGNKTNTTVSIGDEGESNLRQVDSSRTAPSSVVQMSGSVVESHADNMRSHGVEPPKQQVQPNNYDRQIQTPLTKEDQEKALLEKYGGAAPKVETNTTNATLEEIAYGEDKPSRERNTTRQPRPSAPQPEVATTANDVYDNAKKTYSLKVDLKIDEKIPNKTVFKFLEENFDFDESPIDYYTKFIFNKLMSNPKILEEQIKKSIEKYIKGRTTSK